MKLFGLPECLKGKCEEVAYIPLAAPKGAGACCSRPKAFLGVKTVWG